ncbi:hypothetical protein [uncultured Alloprevotella sp.]|uniref:hypothetical protein n=1 Tax=uncultured Alloprevotella sp. TaxID=1283315 RepID=UPI0026136395|nr:hypothetical protein [uncultured Alloprevotella sp.]
MTCNLERRFSIWAQEALTLEKGKLKVKKGGFTTEQGKFMIKCTKHESFLGENGSYFVIISTFARYLELS